MTGAEERIRHVKVEGNRALRDSEIRKYLYLQPTTWFPLPKRRYFFEGYLPVDRKRIEALYGAHGYYAARVLDVDVDRSDRKGVVDIAFLVDEGEPTLVRSIDFAWPDGLPSGPRDRRATPRRIEAHSRLTVGKPFDVEALNEAESTMRVALQSRGYAFAEVRSHARVDRVARHADVRFELRPGPWVRIGKIAIEGLETVPDRLVRVEVDEYYGRPFSPNRIENIEQAIYALGVFSTVSVLLADAPRDGYVDITIRVSETKPQVVKLGVGIGLEPNRWEQYIATQYRHDNLFGNLTQLELRAKAGYAELPALYNPREHGPVLEVKPSLTKKGLLERKLIWTLAPELELGIQEGYQFYAAGNRMGVSRFFTRYVETSLTHNFRFVDFIRVEETLDVSRSILGPDFRDPYLLSYIEAQLRLHFTDRLIVPRNGVVLGVTYDLAGGIFGGMFDAHKVTPELRGYWTPLRKRLQFAVRGQAGMIFPFGDEPGIPFDLKYYLGGAASVRGWGLRRLSPFVQSCFRGDCRRIPVGGNTMVMGNFETRVRVWRDLWTVAFADMGDVRPGVAEFVPREWNYSAGPGLRYDSKIGTFRVDVGFRLNRTPRFEDEPIWALHFGLGEAF